jgi:diguanylate cyclase (GGDEF)-like protein/PAS domain S-box-containing protein
VSPDIDRDEWRNLIVGAGDLALLAFDATGRIVFGTDAAATLIGRTADQLLGTNALDLVHPDDLSRGGANVEGVAMGARPRPGMLHVRHLNGTWVALEMTPWVVELPPPPDGPGQVTAVLLRDTSQNDAYWAFLASLAAGVPFPESLELFARGMSSDIDGPMGVSWEDDGVRHSAGLVPAALTGVTPQRTLDTTPGTPWDQAVRTGHVSWTLTEELPEPHRSHARSLGAGVVVALPVHDVGAAHPALAVQTPADPAMGPILAESIRRRPHEALAVALDRRSIDRRLARLAMQDSLTELANRARLLDCLDELSKGPDGYGICYVDLDRFKPINDAHGHRIGDEVLVATAGRLVRAARGTDLVARLGGDEFAIACEGVTPDELEAIGGRIVAAMTAPVRVGNLLLPVGATVGCVVGEAGADPDAVLGAADAALYEAKRAGRSCVRRGATVPAP